ncbi:MAG: RagB/SusD family nutrient uptake outer membrane protein, partial [Parafilimonas sp.]
QGNVDPRLDWTVGRRAVPYLDWTSEYFDPNYTMYNNYWVGYPSNPGSDPAFGWINDRTFGGPYNPVKNNYRASQVGTYSDVYAQGYLLGSAVNYSIIRFADVLLWAAECEVENGSLSRAQELVNYVRARARDGRTVPVTYDYEGSYYASANYSVDTYKDPWTSQDDARKAVRFERRLEFGLEGQRFFDLVRWGIAADYINSYLSVEKTRIQHLNGVNFVAGKNEYFPIPQQEVDLSNSNGKPLIQQNPGY